MKTIIIYTTKYGCTEKVALLLKEHLKGEVQLLNLLKEKAPSLKSFDRVIIGGSIYFGKIQKELTEYMNESVPELLEKPLGLFICAGAPEEETRKQELKQSFPEILLKHSSCQAILGSEVDYDKLRLFDKLIFRVVSKSKESFSHIPENEIQDFALALAPK
ncbi:flavodoxin domain-containing protein [Caldalkalibacillus mannanilyticus]|uniref:flavodoxin domain-containing protein n=1 Tax=Caldalkalibacillus mannanilyticus TaxID=1418 RepID=UPI00046A8468|nr:flavodoxin domain-containing protein [Caldalkalibacillus mannanilyticus]